MKKIMLTVTLLSSAQHLLADEEIIQQSNDDQGVTTITQTMAEMGTENASGSILENEVDFLDDVADEVEDVQHEDQKVEYTPAMIATYVLASVKHFVIEPLCNAYQTVKQMILSIIMGNRSDQNNAS